MEHTTSKNLFTLVVINLLLVIPAFAQSSQRTIRWANAPISDKSTKVSIGLQVLAEVDALAIIDVTVGGNSVTIGKSFTAYDDWLKTVTFKVRNISNRTISSVQIDLFLPQIMPGGPQVPICYGCGDTRGRVIEAGEVVELTTSFYSWVESVIKEKSSLSNITEAQIQHVVVTLPDGRKWLSGCMKTVDAKNACPKEQ